MQAFRPDRCGRGCPGLLDRRWARRLPSWPRDRDAPGQLADLDGFDHLLRGDIDDRNIVRYSVSHEQIFFVRSECHMPDTLANQQILGDLMAGGIDDGDTVGGAERDEG